MRKLALFSKVFFLSSLFAAIFSLDCALVPELNTVRVDKIARGPEFAPYSGIKRRLAVLDFENDSGFASPRLGSAIADMLISRLARSGRFILVERSKIDQILQEQGIGQSGVISEETAPQVGKLLGVESVVVGKIFRAGQETKGGKVAEDKNKWSLALKATVGFITISYRIISTETGEVIFSDQIAEKEVKPGIGLLTKDYDFSTMYDFDQTVIGVAVEKAVNKMAMRIAAQVERISWTGKIIQAKSDSVIYFTPGIESGIKLGQFFWVIEHQDEFADPKAKIVSTGFIGDKVTRARLLSGGDIQRGDRVKLASLENK